MSQPGNTPALSPLAVELRPIEPDDRGYIRRTWFESYKQAPRMERLPWPVFKQTAGKHIDELLERPDVHLMGGYHESGKVLGWCAWTPGRSVSTLHWVYTRFQLGDEHTRRRHVATQLLEAAELGRRIVYTFVGTKRQRGPSMDKTLVEWAQRRGVVATHAPIEEFLK
jgi:hypothetical protein